MTRMLVILLSLLLLSTNFIGCSSTDSSSSEQVEDIDTDADDLLDAEDEMLDESEDLAENDINADDDDFGEDEEDDEEFADEDSSFADTDEDEDDELNDNDFEDEYDEDEFVSASNDSEVDQNLLNDELGDSAADTSFLSDAQEPVDNVFTEPIIETVERSDYVSTGNQVTNLEYKSFENGGTVIIETESPARFQKIVDTQTNQVIIQVNGASIPPQFQRPYITKDFKQDIAAINAYPEGDGARFIIQMKRPVDPAVVQEGNAILVLTSQVIPGSLAKVDNPASDPRVIVHEEKLGTDAMTPMQTSVPSISVDNGQASAAEPVAEKVQFTGTPISVEFIDEEVRTIIEVIAEKSGVNLIMDSDIQGKTSIRLRDIPWDQALMVLLRSQGLGYVREGSVLRVAKQETLSQEASDISKKLESERKARLLAGGIKVKYIPVSYGKVSELAEKVQPFLSEEGKIAYDDRTSSLVVTDYGEFVSRIEELVKALDTQPMQVQIESKLVEARESFVRESGINWNFNGQPVSVGAQTLTPRGSLAAPAGNIGGLSLDLSIGTFDIFGDLTAALKIFEDENKVQVLSQPRIVTMNKVKASIEQTTQIPINVTTILNGQETATVQFQDLTLGLSVTPQITFNGDVILEVDLRREFPGVLASDGNRELNRRRAQTTVMVKNGKTAVIGGIYQVDTANIENGISGLRDIPLLGNLFGTRQKERNKNELLLFLKPKILKDTDTNSMAIAPVGGGGDQTFDELNLDEGEDVSIEGIDDLNEDDDLTDQVSELSDEFGDDEDDEDDDDEDDDFE